ncbi:MAG: hypothetical protein KGI67_13380, partial [Pseudomonadota bacterium]|nr:hypothetical protein [Pseudomonadota bacterium]
MKGLTPRCGWLAGALWLLLVPALARAEVSAALPEAVDEQVERGWDHPVEALRALDALATRFPAGAGRTRMLLLGRGLVAAASAHAADTAEVMSALARLDADPLSKADIELVRATRADADGDGDAVMKAGAAALEIYRLNCPEAAGCDYRSSWHALKLLARHEAMRGQSHVAFEYAQAAADLAASKGDRPREALSRGMMANVLGEQGDAARAHQQLAAALQLARSTGLPAIESRLQICVQIAAERRGDLAAAWRAGSTALALARLADSPRLIAQQQGNLADIA